MRAVSRDLYIAKKLREEPSFGIPSKSSCPREEDRKSVAQKSPPGSCSARHAASRMIPGQILRKKFAENVETDRPRIANRSHTPYRSVPIVPEGHMAYDGIDDEVAVVLKFVVACLLPEKVATGAEVSHLDHPREDLNVPGVVLSHCAEIAIELFCQGRVRLDVLFVLIQGPADDETLENMQEELFPVLR